MSDSDYIDPVVAAVVGDITDLLSKLGEAEGAMAGFVATAPELGTLSIGGDGAENIVEQLGTQIAHAAAAQGDAAGAAFASGFNDALGAELSDDEYDAMLAQMMTAAGASSEQIDKALSNTGPEVREWWDGLSAAVEAGTVKMTDYSDAAAEMAAGVGRGGLALQAEAQWVDQLSTQLAEMAALETAAGDEAETAGEKAAASAVDWTALGLAAAAVEFGIGAGVLAASAAVVGIGLLIADLGGEAKGDLQQVEDAFRSTAEQSAQAWEPALQQITQGLSATIRDVEPEMAAAFQELSGPAQDFFAGLDSSVEQGMSALVPALGQLAPLISSISGDLGPLAQGAAEFVGDMSQAFEAGGGEQELAQLAQEIGTLLPVLGELTGEVGAGLLPVAEALTPVLQAVADILNALGPNFTTAAAAAYLAYQGWGLLTSASGFLIDGFDRLMGLLAADAVEQEAVAGTGVEAAAAMEAEGVAAAAASIGFVEAAAALVPWVAAAAVAALAAYELIDHWSAVSSFFGQLGSDMYQWGADIVDGLARGIEDAWNFVMAPFEHMIDGLKDAFTSGFGIASPSTVMRGYGVNLGEGAALGILDSLGVVGSAAAQFTGSAVAAFGVPAAAASLAASYAPAPAATVGVGGGGTTVVNLQLTVEAPLASATAAEIADAIVPVVQQLNIGNGTSMLDHTGLKGT